MYTLDQFLEFEKAENLFDLQYKGVYYWHLIRYDIYKMIFNRNTSFTSGKKAGYLRQISALLRSVAQIPYYFRRRKSPLDLFINYAGVERALKGERLNPYIDFLQKDQTLSKQTCFFYVYPSIWPPQPGMNTMLLDALYTPVALLKAFQAASGIGSIQSTSMQHLLDAVERHFSITLDSKRVYRLILFAVSKHLLFRRAFRFLLRNQYRCVVTGCHYENVNFALIDAAKGLGIPVVELQHGVIGDQHPSYNFADLRSNGKYLPDYIFMYGDYWKVHSRLPESCHALSLGAPPMETAQRIYGDTPSDPKRVVFYSNIYPNDVMLPFAMEFAKIVAPHGYKTVVKFHPAERLTWRERYPALAEDTLIECDDRNVSVYEVIASANHHVGVSSTCLFEALAMRKNVYVVKASGWNYMKDIIDAGTAPLLTTPEALWELIQEGKTLPQDMVEQIYRPRATENCLIALRALINHEAIAE